MPIYKKLNTTSNYRLNNKTSFISFKIDVLGIPAAFPSK
jgi:hypothetical protein